MVRGGDGNMSEPASTSGLEPARLPSGRAAMPRWRRITRWAAALLGLVVVYYLAGSFLYYRIGDDPDFAPPAPIEGGSRTVDMAAALIEREVVTHAWQPNDPVFMPNGLLIHPAAYQAGIQGALARVSFELVDQIGRTRGSSRADPDLERAAGLLQFPPNVWFFDFRKSLLPAITSEHQYRTARQALLAYNQRLAQKGAVFDVRTDSLAATINRIVADLGSRSALIDQHLRDSSGWLIDFDADRLFYDTKGRLYGYHMLLRELGQDFAPIIQQNNLQAVYAQALDTMREAGTLRPFFVIDAAPNGMLFTNHLAIQGFYLKRTLVQLTEIAQVLVN
jgi:hypothetical protein